MGFKKLALAVAVAAAPMSALALEPMQDEALSAVTGQDGISMNIDVPSLSLAVNVHDNDGIGTDGPYGIGTPGAGAIVIGNPLGTANGPANLTLATGAGGIDVKIDADNNGDSPVLNVNVTIPTGTTINTGDISVATSNGMGTDIANQSSTILDSMAISLGQTTMNIQLGSEPQGDMIALNTTISGGINISGFSLNDATAGTGGALSAASIAITGTAEANGDITTAMGVNLDSTDGLVIDIDTLGTSGLNLAITDLALGNGTSIGDVEVIGLNLNGTQIAVSGH